MPASGARARACDGAPRPPRAAPQGMCAFAGLRRVQRQFGEAEALYRRALGRFAPPARARRARRARPDARAGRGAAAEVAPSHAGVLGRYGLMVPRAPPAPRARRRAAAPPQSHTGSPGPPRI